MNDPALTSAVAPPREPGLLKWFAPERGVDFGAFVIRKVFANPYIWLFALANFFVYVVRYAVLEWGPTLLSEAKGLKLAEATRRVTAFEVSSVAGMLLCGWITDRVFGGRSARTCLFCMLFVAIAVLVFWRLPSEARALEVAMLCVAGFFIYGPQALIGIAVANLVTKRAAATAAGFTGILGYASTLLSVWGLGWLVQHYGWDAGLAGLALVAVVGALLFALAWPARPHGYETAQP